MRRAFFRGTFGQIQGKTRSEKKKYFNEKWRKLPPKVPGKEVSEIFANLLLPESPAGDASKVLPSLLCSIGIEQSRRIGIEQYRGAAILGATYGVVDAKSRLSFLC